MILNLYGLIAIVFAISIIAVVFLIAMRLAIRNKVNFEVSKDKLSIQTNTGLYTSADKNKSIIIVRDELIRADYRIRTHDIIEEQMKFLERQSVSYYREIQSGLTEEERHARKKHFELHRYKMLDVFRDDVLKANHFLEKTDWDGYKGQIFEYCFGISCELFAEIESPDSKKILVMDEAQTKELRMLFGSYFYGWMDRFRQITKEKLDEVGRINAKIQKLNKELGFMYDESELEEL